MATVAPQSENIEKVKVANQKEDVRLRLRMQDMQKQKRRMLEGLQREQMNMVHQVKANRIRELRNGLRRGLGMEEQVNMMRQRVFHQGKSEANARSWVAENTGFSKVDVEEEDDTEVYMDFVRSKTSPELHILQAMWAKRREQEESKNGGKSKTPEEFDIRDTEVFVRYPTEANTKTQGIICVKDVEDMQKLKMHQLQKKPGAQWRPQSEPIGVKRSRYPVPKYVKLMQRQWDTHYDMYTDGTMLLEVRKAKQRQRERTPVPVGFLPVRKRFTEDVTFTRMPKELKKKVASSAPAMQIHGKEPNRVNVYLPKSPETTTKEEEKEEHERLLKLKKADQADLYEDTLKSTSGFLGKDPLVHNSVHKEKLNVEELMMLSQLRSVPEFRGSAKSVSSYHNSSRASLYTSRPQPSRVNHRIRDIMSYVMNKDYTSDKGDTPPPRLYQDDDGD